jgi:Flp pilus assembly protein TadG
MINRIRHLRRDESGMQFVFVGFGFMAFMAASMLAIDVGLLLTARTQAQTSADAGALAGATALVFNSFTDHSATGPAVTSAVNTSRANLVVRQVPSVTPDDVTFPLNPTTGQFDQVQVTVYRTQERSNPVATLVAAFYGSPSANIAATATAMAAPATGMNCVLPFTIPDKWMEMQCDVETCPWAPTDSFNMFATQGNHSNAGAPLPNPDVYVPPGQPGATGYKLATDIGLLLTLKPSSQNEVSPSFFNAWDIGDVTGADAYGENISTCNPLYTETGNAMLPETGNMVGPTTQSTKALIDQDPNARWDASCNNGVGCVVGWDKAKYPLQSPRIRPVPLYDPVLYAMDQHSGKSQPILKIVSYIGFFIESVDNGGTVKGRIVPMLGTFNPGMPVAGEFARAIVLVK